MAKLGFISGVDHRLLYVVGVYTLISDKSINKIGEIGCCNFFKQNHYRNIEWMLNCDVE